MTHKETMRIRHNAQKRALRLKYKAAKAASGELRYMMICGRW